MNSGDSTTREFQSNVLPLAIPITKIHLHEDDSRISYLHLYLYIKTDSLSLNAHFCVGREYFLIDQVIDLFHKTSNSNQNKINNTP